MAPAIIYHIFLLFLLPFLNMAQSNGTIPVGSTLTAGDDKSSPWISASGDFAFGFHQIDEDINGLFLISIWYNKIPENTVVWYANKDNNPAAVPRGSQVKLTADQGLQLNDPQGKQIWSSGVDPGRVSYGFMNDTGNFELASSSSSGVLWDSFSNPTDTLLPTQIMHTDGILFSRQSETNFSRGRFQFRLLGDGNLVLNTANLPTNVAYDSYYVSGTFDPENSSNSGFQVVFNESGYMYILRRNGTRFDLTTERTVPAADFYHRATLNFDGVFAQYFHPKTGNGNWSVVWFKPDNICVKAMNAEEGSGACGFNSICMLNGDQRPTCNCPKGYSLADENDKFGNCKPNFELSCNEGGKSYNKDLYDLYELADTDWPLSGDYEKFTPYDEVQCKNSCLSDCFCAAATFLENKCWLKNLPLANGRIDRGFNGRAFVKYRKGDVNNVPDPVVTDRLPNPENPKKQNKMTVTGSLLLGSSVFLNFVLVIASGVGFFFIYKKNLMRSRKGESSMETNMRCFSYKELVEATNNFNEEVGRGSFGVVYKGVIKTNENSTYVAVKKLDRVFQDGEKEFRNEVIIIGQTHHKNLVRLIGFCDGGHNLIVYEFLNNGTVASFLFGNSPSKPSWNMRTQIALGIARGILYLHEECSTQIIHCDIKPQNILLDEYYNARISDFGLAKLLTLNQSQTKTAIRGTKGYVAPEWFRNSAITAKVDVYSFGVLLLEIISCKKCVDVEMGEEFAILTDWAFDCYKHGKLDALVEEDEEAINDLKNLERFLKIAIWCIQEDPSRRPTMKKVLQMLEGVVEVSVPPNPSPFGTSIS